MEKMLNHPGRHPAWKPGQSGNPKGRPKGAKNKFRIDVLALLEKKNFDPFLKLIEIAEDPTVSVRIRMEAAAEIASYVAPKLKAVEFKDDGGNGDRPRAVLIIPDNERDK